MVYIISFNDYSTVAFRLYDIYDYLSALMATILEFPLIYTKEIYYCSASGDSPFVDKSGGELIKNFQCFMII